MNLVPEKAFLIKAGRTLTASTALETPGTAVETDKAGQAVLDGRTPTDVDTMYVDTTAGNDANPGTTASPKLTYDGVSGAVASITTQTYIQFQGTSGATTALAGSDLTIKTECAVGIYHSFTFTTGEIQNSCAGIEFGGSTPDINSASAITIQDCTLANNSVTNSGKVTIDRCIVTGITFDAGSSFECTSTLFKSTTTIDTTATGGLDAKFYQCTFGYTSSAATIDFNNTSGTGLEEMKDCLLVGNISATESFIWTSGNIYNGTVTNVELGPNVKNIDPLQEQNLTFDIRRVNQSYYNGTETLVSQIDSAFVNGSTELTLASGVRDSGAQSWDNGTQTYEFLTSHYMTLPIDPKAIKFTKEFQASNLQVSINGTPTNYNDTNRIMLRLTIDLSGGVVRKEDLDYLTVLESLRDTTVIINLDPTNTLGITDTRNTTTNYSAGVQYLRISGSEIIPVGAQIQVSSTTSDFQYLVIASDILTSGGNSSIVLDRLTDMAITTGTDISILSPADADQWVYVTKNRSWHDAIINDNEFQAGTKLEFVKKFT